MDARGGAVVWPEVEGLLAHHDGWLAEHAPDLGPARHIDPHHLGHARQVLLDTGRLQRVDVQLSGRTVTAFLDGTAVADRRRTTVERAGATKRRLYRSLLGWTSDTRLCGQVAERHVAATLEHLAGRAIWLDPERGAGEVRTLAGDQVPGGPLDHTGHVAIDPGDPTAGFVPFVIEDKNVRQTLYPEHREIWDLLWKAGHYPDHLPVLIAPRFHHTTFVLFSAIGAIAVPTVRQWFAPDPTIATRRFQTVTRSLAIGHAAQLSEPDKPSAALSDFFIKTLHKATRRHPDRPLLAVSLAACRPDLRSTRIQRAA